MNRRFYVILWEWIVKFLQKLEPRERLFLLSGVLFLLVVSLVAGTYQLYKVRRRISQEVTESRYEFQRIHRLREQILDMGVAKELPDQRQFFASVNSLLQQNELTPSNVDEKKAGQGGRQKYEVSIKFRSVNLVKFLDFVYDLEYGNKVAAAVYKLEIRRAISAKELYDANIVVGMRGG